MDKNFGNQEKFLKFVVSYWIRYLMQWRMKSKIMKQIEKYNVHLNPELDHGLTAPHFQEKIDEGNALLAQVGLPQELRGRFR